MFVIGDGKTTIEWFVAQKQDHFAVIERDTEIDLGDFGIKQKLKRKRLNLRGVIAEGKKVFLLVNANSILPLA